MHVAMTYQYIDATRFIRNSCSGRNLHDRLQHTVIVAMSLVGMVQMVLHQVVHVIAVRDSFVSAIRTMDVACLVSPTLVVRRAR